MEVIRHMRYPDELYALIKYKIAGCHSNCTSFDMDSLPASRRRCYELLRQTSRSFATVIQQLDGQLRDAVCIFYLVLRALDTVEDDMSIPNEIKIPMLKTFHKNLYDPDWHYTDSQEKDKAVLEEFNIISLEFRGLHGNYCDVICNICERMGEGMAKYMNHCPVTLSDWDEYCHYVAGLVGIGLSRLFSASQLEDKIIGYDTRLANSMGLFLQKTNIIRDIHEDVTQCRYFWPKQVWAKYTDNLCDITAAENRGRALQCLNELVTNALQHIPDVIKYLSRLKDPSVFRFCALPQVMAIATLERCYSNSHVFDGVVKIRKGETIKMLTGSSCNDSVKAIFKHFLNAIQRRIPHRDPSAAQTRAIITKSMELVETSEQFVSTTAFLPLYVLFGLLLSAILWQYHHGICCFTGKFSDPNHTKTL